VSPLLAARVRQAVDPGSAQREARHILSDRKFRSTSTPRPLRGPLRWLGDRLGTLFGPIGRFFGLIPGPVWILVLIAVIALLVVLGVRARRRLATRAPSSTKRARGGMHDDEEDPDALERAADEAEHDGDLARALRLRFRAGLLRLGDRGAIRYRPSVTTGEVRRALGSATFDDLAGTFEAVTYGGRTAEPPDVERARRGWPRVLEETGRR
jgi:Sec-independent protein translocase protein TatA